MYAPKEIVMTRIEQNSPKKKSHDIDNTLWQLAPALWKHLKTYNPKMPPPSYMERLGLLQGYIYL